MGIEDNQLPDCTGCNGKYKDCESYSGEKINFKIFGMYIPLGERCSWYLNAQSDKNKTSKNLGDIMIVSNIRNFLRKK